MISIQSKNKIDYSQADNMETMETKGLWEIKRSLGRQKGMEKQKGYYREKGHWKIKRLLLRQKAITETKGHWETKRPLVNYGDKRPFGRQKGHKYKNAIRETKSHRETKRPLGRQKGH